MTKIKLNQDMGKAVLASGYKLDPKEQYCICLEDEIESQGAIFQAIQTMKLPAIEDYYNWLEENSFSSELPDPTNAFVAPYFGTAPLWITNSSQGIIMKCENDDDYYIIMECSRENEGFKYTQIILTPAGCM